MSTSVTLQYVCPTALAPNGELLVAGHRWSWRKEHEAVWSVVWRLWKTVLVGWREQDADNPAWGEGRGHLCLQSTRSTTRKVWQPDERHEIGSKDVGFCFPW